jgi:superfamily I DNA/RNA helicase
MGKRKKFDFIPSPYQEKIFDFITEGYGNAVVSAKAGSGKTFTIVNAMKLIPKTKKAIFIAFNKSIADELNEKLKNNSNCMAYTTHSLGFRMIRRNLGNDIIVDEYKYRTYLKNNFLNVTGLNDGEINIEKNQINEYTENILLLIDFSRLFLAHDDEAINNIVERYDVPLIANEVEVVKRCLEWGKNNITSIDYADMLWLPTALNLRPLGMLYDWVFLDEAQDSSIAAIALFKKCVKPNVGRWVCVGDEKQCINLFCGSNEDNFRQLCHSENTQVFDLPVSYRCGKKIIEFSQSIVKDILPKENAIDGEIKNGCKLSCLKDGDMVLARSKAPLLKVYTKLIKKGINCYIKGLDIGANLINLLDSIKGEELNINLRKDGVFIRLYDKLFETRDKLVEKRGLDIDDATLSSYIMEQYDTIKALEVLAFNCATKNELKARIKDIFKEDSKGVCLSTIHKSKGLEADNVYILCHSSMPSKNCHHEWERIQEKNLMYVAYTRAKKILGFISEKEVPPTGSMSEPEDILNELNYIESKVCEILGRVPLQKVDSVEMAKARLQKMEKVELPKKKKEKKIKVVSNKKDSNKKLLSDLEKLF